MLKFSCQQKNYCCMIPKSSILNLCFGICTILLFGSCVKDKLTKTYTIYTPVYQTREEVIASIKNGPVQSLSSPGKIYMYNHYIFLNEINRGVHIIDNRDPAAPKIKAFIKIPGNNDIAVRGKYLYADMFTDLVTIDISDPLNTRLISVLPKLFPERLYGSNFEADTSKVLVDWIARDTIVQEGTNPWAGGCRNCFLDFAAISGNSNTGVPGTGGSMARFTIVNDYMYTVGTRDLTALSLTEPAEPRIEKVSQVGMDIETIFPFKDKLFIGSSSGMFIYGITNASAPDRLSSFSHARACDPVVADDKYAYVTLRTGNWCGGVQNVLDVVDVSNVLTPRLVATHQLVNPHGLSKDDNLLFICDGRDGIKMFDVSNVKEPVLLHHVKGLDTYDAIAWNNKLLVVSKTGIDQFDYSSRNSLKHLSNLKINGKQ